MHKPPLGLADVVLRFLAFEELGLQLAVKGAPHDLYPQPKAIHGGRAAKRVAIGLDELAA